MMKSISRYFFKMALAAMAVAGVGSATAASVPQDSTATTGAGGTEEAMKIACGKKGERPCPTTCGVRG